MRTPRLFPSYVFLSETDWFTGTVFSQILRSEACMMQGVKLVCRNQEALAWIPQCVLLICTQEGRMLNSVTRICLANCLVAAVDSSEAVEVAGHLHVRGRQRTSFIAFMLLSKTFTKAKLPSSP